jgi:tripartite-type tricarboxylate transporter receptor subunit TctC
MIKKSLVTVLLAWLSFNSFAENITLVLTAAPSHPTSPPMLKLLEEANKLQKDFTFVPEFKPGGEGTIGLKHMLEDSQRRMATIAPAFVEAAVSGTINENDYVPVFSQGDSCWAVITNVGNQQQGLDSIKGVKEIVVGGVGFGNAAHITGIMIGEKYNIPVRYVVFKSNFDALVNMVANNGVNMVLERVANYTSFKPRNENLQMLAMSCPRRHPDAPTVKTLKELGLDAPYVFQVIVASKNMSVERRRQIESIFEETTKKIGRQAIQTLSDQNPPVFYNISSQQHFEQSVAQVKALRRRYREQIEAAK